MNQYKTLGIDLDGTTYNFYDLFKNWWAELQGVDPLTYPREPQEWGFFEAWGCSISRFKEMLCEGLVSHRLFWEGDPYPDAVETIQNLSEDHRIVIVTSRNFLGYEKESEAATTYWLKSNNIPFDELILTDDKTGRGLDLLLDDSPHIIKAAVEVGENAVFFDAPHNSHIDHPRVKSWKEFEEYVRA